MILRLSEVYGKRRPAAGVVDRRVGRRWLEGWVCRGSPTGPERPSSRVAMCDSNSGRVGLRGLGQGSLKDT